MPMMVGARSTQSCEINVTPLIDVLLVLLIIFMVILPEHKWGEKTLVPQPSTESSEKNPETPIVIQLKDVGESKRPLLKINRRKFPGTLWSRGLQQYSSSGLTGWLL